MFHEDTISCSSLCYDWGKVFNSILQYSNTIKKIKNLSTTKFLTKKEEL